MRYLNVESICSIIQLRSEAIKYKAGDHENPSPAWANCQINYVEMLSTDDMAFLTEKRTDISRSPSGRSSLEEDFEFPTAKIHLEEIDDEMPASNVQQSITTQPCNNKLDGNLIYLQNRITLLKLPLRDRINRQLLYVKFLFL